MQECTTRGFLERLITSDLGSCRKHMFSENATSLEMLAFAQNNELG